MAFAPNWKLAAVLVLAFAGTAQTRGCTDREIAAGVAGGVLGAIFVDSQRPVHVHPAPPRRNCEPVSDTRCWAVTDYYGRVIGEECETERYRSCGRYKMELAGGSDLNVNEMAEAYKLKVASAEKLVGALARAQSAQDDASASAALQSICLNVEELKSMGKSGSLSATTVDCLARTLDQDPTQTAMMVNSITETARAQEAARMQNQSN